MGAAARSLVAFAALAACSAHAPSAVVAHQPSPVRPPIATAVSAPLPTRIPDSPPETADQVMGWAVIHRPGALVRAVAEAATSEQLEQLGTEPQVAAWVLLLQSLDLEPHVVEAIDPRRPAGVALLNPSLQRGAAELPLLAMLPVQSRGAVEKVLTSAGVDFERTGWGVIITTGQGRVFVAFRDGYALVAYRQDLLAAAETILGPPLARRGEAPLLVHLELPNVYAAYGSQIEASLTAFAQSVQSHADPQLAYALRTAWQMARFATDLRSLELSATADERGVDLRLRVDGNADSAWAKFVAAQRSGPTWGTRFVPRDAVLVYASHRSAAGRDDELESAVAYLGDALSPPATEPTRARWRGALGRASDQMTGEVIYSIWPGEGGGVGVGGAYQVREPRSARRELAATYRHLGRDMGGVVARALQLESTRFPLDVRVASRGDVDLVEVSVRWPKGARAERALFERLFGPRLTLATTVVGDSALFALGRGWSTRLEQLTRAARSGAAPSLNADERFGRALADDPEGRVSLSYLPLAPMSRFIVGLLRDGRRMKGEEIDAVAPVLAQAGPGAIITTTHAHGARYEVASHLPASALPQLSQLGGVMWRIALSPLLNPPLLPPLPLPPSQVTPRMPRRPPSTSAAEGTRTL